MINTNNFLGIVMILITSTLSFRWRILDGFVTRLVVSPCEDLILSCDLVSRVDDGPGDLPNIRWC